MTRFALALPRCLVLSVLSAAGFTYGVLLLVAATLVIPYPRAVAGQFQLVALGRRLARAWGEADLPDIERAPPPQPQRRADGWYVHGSWLFKTRAMPAWLAKAEHYGDDPEIGREWRWLVLAPVTSALPVLLPTALAVAGVVVYAWSKPVAVAVFVCSLLLAPGTLRVYGRWTRSMLQGATWAWPTKTAPWRWTVRAWTATWRAAGLAGLAFAALGATLLTSIAVVVSWGGLLLWVALFTRPLFEVYRSCARRWAGARLPSPYRPFPAPPPLSEDGTYRAGRFLYTELADTVAAQRYSWISRDPATWRDHLWSLGAPLFGPISLVPAVVLSFGLFGLLWQPVTWAIWAVPTGLATGYWVTPLWLWYSLEYAGVIPAGAPDWWSIPAGLVLTLLGLALATPVMRLRLWWDGLLLDPTPASVLALRVAELRSSRADTVDVQAAELRRIERDLHDGAQARLVAVGLGLGAVARLMETDPVRARQLLTQAQETSAAALEQLRDLVRGIHPPVLAERGLADAIRALALDTPLPVSVDADLPGRAEPPVESALYFAVCEALANATRVASQVLITLSHHDGVMRLVMTDDGPGGADPANGTGLRGISRRLNAFDGTLTLHSPAGGPTVIIMEIPCALSSPRTSTS